MVDDKLDMILRKLNRLSKGQVTNSADTADDSVLPDGITLPLDSVRGVTELDSRLVREPDTKRKLVSNICIQ